MLSQVWDIEISWKIMHHCPLKPSSPGHWISADLWVTAKVGEHSVQVSTGVTLRENNLKEIEGGRIIDSQGVLVANKRALREQPGLLAVVHELIERLEVLILAACLHDIHWTCLLSWMTLSDLEVEATCDLCAMPKAPC